MESKQRQHGAAAALAGLAVAMSVGCARPANIVIAAPVGPPIAAATDAQQGQLVVYNDSTAHPDPAESFQQHGTGRLGFIVADAASGAVVESIPTGLDSVPTLKLNPGRYLVHAESLSGATVEATVRVETGKTTELYLDGSRTLSNPSNNGNAVLAPDGSFVGWRSASL